MQRLLYSKKIVAFIHEIKTIAKKILSEEMGLKVHGDRFYHQNYSYPLSVVVFNDQKMLGYFASDFMELGFHETLLRVSQEKLSQIIRHELAHYLVFIKYGNDLLPHGKEFRDFCRSLNWNEEVYLATTCLDDGINEQNCGESDVLRKIKKLMALATSSNVFEAEQAMMKSQQLMQKHNIETIQEADEVYLKRILKQKKKNAKMRAMAVILETFFVNTIFSKRDGFICLEIIGNATNVSIAEYVAHFLENEFETQWKLAKKGHCLSGQVAKNSFILGIAKGYCSKVQALKRESHEEKALMVIEKQLQEAVSLVYPRLRSTVSSTRYCSHAASLGHKVGRSMSINPGLFSNNFLGYFSL